MPQDTLARRVAAFLGKGPSYLLSYAAWRISRALAARDRPAWPSDQRVVEALRLPDARGASASALRAHFLSRRNPPPLFDPSRLTDILGAIPEAVRSETMARAEKVLRKEFRYRGREVSFSGEVDWNSSPGGNLDWTWDLNRHYFFPLLGRAYLYSGDERYAAGFAELFSNWMARNPPGPLEPHWRRPFEVGARAANWCWAHAMFLRSPSLDDAAHFELAKALFAMGQYLARNLERHIRNNHLLLEAKALAMLGLLYPEFSQARRWKRVGLEALEAQVRRQVLPDGVHSERSSLYHEIVASELLELLVILELCGESRHLRAFREAWERMARFLQAIARADGSRPLLGDASRGDLHVRYDVLWGLRILRGEADRVGRGPLDAPWVGESTVWLLAARGPAPKLTEDAPPCAAELRGSAAFPRGGYYVLQAPSRERHWHLVVDCGPFGDRVAPGHGHADALSVDLAAGPGPILVDPGSYSAHLGKRWRNFFRGSASHNTLVVDGRDQSELLGLREVYRPAQARAIGWFSCEQLDFFAGEHYGYRRLRPGVVHRRMVFFWKPRWWLVVDRVTGMGYHRYDLLFHLHPSLRGAVDPDAGDLVARDGSGRGAAFLSVGALPVAPEVLQGVGDEAPVAGPIQGWVSFHSGVREPAPVLCHRFEGAPPLTFATLIFPLESGASQAPRLERLAAFGPTLEGVPVEELVAARLLYGSRTETLLISPAPEGSPTRGAIRAGDLETDGFAALLEEDRDARPRSGAMLGGTRLGWKRREILRIEPRGGPADIAFEITEDAFRLFGSAPEGSAVVVDASSASRVVFNSVDVPCERAGGFLKARLER